MSNQTVRELRALAEERGLEGYFKLRKAELVSLLGTTSMRPEPEKSLSRVTLLPKPEDMDSFELQEMAKTRSAVKSELNEWYDFIEEQAGVSDAARMYLHLWEMWMTALIGLLFGGGRGVGRGQSADAPVGRADDCAG